MRPLTLARLLLRCGILAIILFVVVVVAMKLGAVQVSLYGLGRDLISVLLHRTSALSSDYGMIVLGIRLPRILLAIFVGASLSVAGVSFQALLRNPLADPYVLGVSSGAALGAIVALILESRLDLTPEMAGLITPVGAFLGAALTIAAVYILGRREGQIDSTTLLLGGIITASFLQAVIMFLMTPSPATIFAAALSGSWAIFPLRNLAACSIFFRLASSSPQARFTPPPRISIFCSLAKKKLCISVWMCRASASSFTSPLPFSPGLP
jgi:ABC-type Fe3+-siderophore transport system permease subunit